MFEQIDLTDGQLEFVLKRSYKFIIDNILNCILSMMKILLDFVPASITLFYIEIAYTIVLGISFSS